ncbi:sensor histidine kinase [Paracidovorax valerianellae]|uniref:histidine kinase n=1 Tax=Paracidovorax valerianellae TaxID=187868 RepID=A0A1G7E9X4_9BURK|nr:HAMP domain-containing sensor histidine kinase [Paracidovorax valerianellae]MDA8447419.1 HAMP domain-containing histidine kinase [Paracidovorax valerianellae]SDE60433.1 His Kinase A (phospho-acceptor) domain-containing protein [Paracidovorax valerianellae]
MRLATFIEASREPILKAAAAYARTIPALSKTDESVLRDHLPHLLAAISADLRTAQSRSESITKSLGDEPPATAETSAQTHGLLRAKLGITIEELVAEFRAMRSSILRLWLEAHPADVHAIEDIARFNEAIDQAVAESVQFFAQERERWRQIFLGILGHDLRGPLTAISLTVELMRARESAPPANIDLLSRGVKRMASLLDSLLEYNRAGFATGMALQCKRVDLAVSCLEEIDLLRVAHPAAIIEFHARGNTEAQADASRVREALSNLVSNAVKHGLPQQEPIVVDVTGDETVVRIQVTNAGDIPPGEIELLFEPLRQREILSPRADRTHLGLGLFIVRQIARAHHGDAVGVSSGGKVRFTVEIPKVFVPDKVEASASSLFSQSPP